MHCSQGCRCWIRRQWEGCSLIGCPLLLFFSPKKVKDKDNESSSSARGPNQPSAQPGWVAHLYLAVPINSNVSGKNLPTLLSSSDSSTSNWNLCFTIIWNWSCINAPEVFVFFNAGSPWKLCSAALEPCRTLQRRAWKLSSRLQGGDIGRGCGFSLNFRSPLLGHKHGALTAAKLGFENQVVLSFCLVTSSQLLPSVPQICSLICLQTRKIQLLFFLPVWC